MSRDFAEQTSGSSGLSRAARASCNKVSRLRGKYGRDIKRIDGPLRRTLAANSWEKYRAPCGTLVRRWPRNKKSIRFNAS
jgi:hypothetical protein